MLYTEEPPISTGHPHPLEGVRGDPGDRSRRQREEDPRCTVRTAAAPTPGSSTPGSPTTAASIRRRRTCPACDEAVHHRRADAAHGAQAQRRDRAVHPREGRRRRPQGLQGPAGLRGRPGLPRPDRRGRAARRGLGGGAGPRGRAWPSSARCASSTRWPTSGSRASTAPSSRPTTSRRDRDAPRRASGRRHPVDCQPQPSRADPDRPAASWGSCARRATNSAGVRLGIEAPCQSRQRSMKQHNQDQGVANMTETVSGAPRARTRKKGLKIERVFSTAGVHPYDEITWERRDVVQTELEDRRVRLRAARRGVPRLLVASTPPRSSPPSTSAAPSAPTSASGASSSSSTGS